MVLLFRVLTRLLLLFFAYISACTAAMATIFAAIWGWQVNYGAFTAQSDAEAIFNIFAYSAIGLVAYGTILYATLVPATVFALVTEGLSWRGLLVHVLGGGAIGLYLLLIPNTPDAPVPQQDVIITLAAGFVGGFVYWLIAGNGAGSWRVLRPGIRTHSY